MDKLPKARYITYRFVLGYPDCEILSIFGISKWKLAKLKAMLDIPRFLDCDVAKERRLKNRTKSKKKGTRNTAIQDLKDHRKAMAIKYWGHQMKPSKIMGLFE
jgi:hypothetical protein